MVSVDLVLLENKNLQMARIINLFYWTSIPFFLGMLLYVYAFLPIKVGLLYDAQGLSSWSMTKELFFYYSIGGFAMINVVIYLYRKSLAKGQRFEAVYWIEMKMGETVYHWLHGLAAAINFLLTFSVIFLGMYHNQEHFDIANYSFLIYLGPILVLGWFFSLFYLLKIGSQN